MSYFTVDYIQKSYIPLLTQAFASVTWLKAEPLFNDYLCEHEQGTRTVFIAFYQQHVIGYVTVKWQSKYRAFCDAHIPEINDLHVLDRWRHKGVGSCLLDAAESVVRIKSNWVGLGVGLYGDYGSAQRLYVTRGYVPDGRGITSCYHYVEPGQQAIVDDALLLWLVKRL